MQRPKAPIDCPYYKAMIEHNDDPVEDVDMEGNKTMIHTGVTLEKLLASESEVCREYAKSMADFRKAHP